MRVPRSLPATHMNPFRPGTPRAGIPGRRAPRTRQAQRGLALLDFDRLTVSSTIDVPPGFETLQGLTFFLAAQVLGHASLVHEPTGKSTRGGSRTGEFTHGSDGAAARCARPSCRPCTPTWRRCASASDHPFTASLPARWRLATWAVALQSQGYQGPHFHPDGRISGVYYVAVPDAVRHAADRAGALEFGRTTGTDAIGGQAQPLLHVVTPGPGQMVVFPSYFYHRTLPFASAQPRISVAFDVLPAGALTFLSRQRALGTRQVLRRIDTRRKGLGCEVHGDAPAGFQRAQLLQRLELLQHAAGKRGEHTSAEARCTRSMPMWRRHASAVSDVRACIQASRCQGTGARG